MKSHFSCLIHMKSNEIPIESPWNPHFACLNPMEIPIFPGSTIKTSSKIRPLGPWSARSGGGGHQDPGGGARTQRQEGHQGEQDQRRRISGFLRDFCGISIGISMMFLWDFYGISMGFLWCFYGISGGFLAKLVNINPISLWFMIPITN